MGGKELAPPCCVLIFFCGRGSNTFAADPPDALDLRRVCKGKNVKTRAVMTGRLMYLSEDARGEPLCEAADLVRDGCSS
ncbi:MAG: hypothetical protein Q8S10_00350, partial [Thiobacillus sp.]|nr:hypothetical protein [Thiobacillus sp.]